MPSPWQRTVPKYALAAAKLAFANEAAASMISSAAMASAANGTSALPSHFDWKKAGIESWGQRGNKIVATMDNGATAKRLRKSTGLFGWGLIRTVSPVFCVPENDTLLSYWDRVEDRLFKIRNCRDITGAKRELSLFAPEIDPRMLVRARAAGLSLDDILAATSGSLPPYRFSYLIERAKAHASAVQSFGSALLGSLEKKDAEELNMLRSVQQGNLLGLATRMRQWEVDAAQDAIETIELQRSAAEYRRDYYNGLSSENLSPTEHTQSDSRNLASGLEKAAAILDTVASIAHLIPQLGSPFAMKFGGLEVGHSATSWSDILRDVARAAEADASAAGLQAGFERRQQGWDHQAVVAQHEIDGLAKQAAAMRIRKQMAERSQQIHDVTLAQQEEVHTFLKERFAGQALYTYLATTLQRLYRDAYTSAYAMARLTEQAYRFERDDQVSTPLQASYWDSAHVGLFAGERLLADLNTMERRFLETNIRSLEIDQPFALSQVAPEALVQLRESGTCTFDLPELFFDLFYPGHYRRRIKAVRLTVACVTGPYTNISATLTLLGSSVRTKPTLDASSLVVVPVRRSASIAASTAQQDAGVFELSFRDERYMPFEGAGAVSKWRLSLPSAWRPFDYRTMNDVILHVMYAAEADEVLRGNVEERTNLIVGSLRDQLAKRSLFRAVSLRQEMSGAFQRLMLNPVGTDVRIKLGPELLPMFLQNGTVATQHARLVVVPARKATVGAAAFKVDGTALSGFTADATLGGLPAKSCDTQFQPSWVGEHTISVVAAGGLDVTNREPGDTSAIDPAKLEDLLLVFEYRP